MFQLVRSAALAFALSAAVISPSFADDDGPGGMMGMRGDGGCPAIGMMGMMGMMGGHWGGERGPGMMRRMPKMGAVVEGRLAYLKGELAITDAETPAWDAYAKAVRDRVQRMQAMHEGMFDAMRKGTAIERIDARIAGMETMLESLKAVKPALEGLYAVLSKDQKQLADDLIGAGCGAM